MAEELIRVCDECPKKKKHPAIGKCRLCEKDLCEGHIVEKEITFYDVCLEHKHKDILCSDCDEKVSDFIDDNIVDEGDYDTDSMDTEEKAMLKKHKEVIKPFRMALEKADLWNILKKSLLLYNLEGKK